MARLSDKSEIYELAERWRKDCLTGDGSLLWQGETIWKKENLEAFKNCFVGSGADESSRKFWEKLADQLKNQNQNVVKLVGELLLIYYLFTASISSETKKDKIKLVLGWKNLQLSQQGEKALEVLNSSIGGTGFYTINIYFEVRFLLVLSLAIKERGSRSFDDPEAFMGFIDEFLNRENRMAQGRDILLHLLYPDYYERIASQRHKKSVGSAFGNLLDNKISEGLDNKIRLIREKLENYMPKEKYWDFYSSPLKELWPNTEKISYLSFLEGLKQKKQIVFHGPPGTGKTYEAKEIAQTFIRQELFKKLGASEYFDNMQDKGIEKYIKRVQFHPNYTYEDFVRGLQLEGNGATVYKEGVLLQFVKEVEKESDIPFVMILDEMNRADLSRVLGECFSLLEDRGEDNKIELAGQDNKKIFFPENLYFIGTMNEIDQSLEQVDFALRRRFLWFFRGFDRERLMGIIRSKWGKITIPPKWDWDKVSEEFERLADNAEALNKKISNFAALGKKYEIGHTYFCEIVDLIEVFLQTKPNSRSVMFSRSGIQEETIGALWEYSLKPLLEQYLSGVDDGKDGFLKDVEDTFKKTD